MANRPPAKPLGRPPALGTRATAAPSTATAAAKERAWQTAARMACDGARSAADVTGRDDAYSRATPRARNAGRCRSPWLLLVALEFDGAMLANLVNPGLTRSCPGGSSLCESRHYRISNRLDGHRHFDISSRSLFTVWSNSFFSRPRTGSLALGLTANRPIAMAAPDWRRSLL
jgi:hypothetical protein